jgi:hypothetical protein
LARYTFTESAVAASLSNIAMKWMYADCDCFVIEFQLQKHQPDLIALLKLESA